MQQKWIIRTACVVLVVGAAINLHVADRRREDRRTVLAPTGSLVVSADLRSSSGYDVVRTAEGLSAANSAQRLVSDFTRAGVHLRAQGGAAAWHFAMRASGVGCEGELREFARGEPEAAGNRVIFRHRDTGSGPGIDEWYINEQPGLEQGFTLHDAPRCQRSAPRRSVALELSLEGDLSASLTQGDQAMLLRDSNGSIRLQYTNLHVNDAKGQPLPARLRLEDDRLAILIDDRRAVYPVVVDPLVWAEKAKLRADHPVVADYFGSSVAISGTTVIVGAFQSDADQDLTNNLGAAYVFARSGEQWPQTAKLVPHDGAPSDFFGHAVAISGDTAVAGSYQHDHDGNLGSAYVFVRNDQKWSEQVELLASDGNGTNRLFGAAVAVSGDTTIVGAPYDGSDTPGLGPGAAYVFVRTGETWTEQAKLTATDAAGGAFFGGTVAISGETAVVGAWNDPANGTLSGSAYVFVRSGDTWMQQDKLNPNDGSSGDRFGWSVAIAGDTAAVGARLSNAQGEFSGSAYVFVRSGSTWQQQAKLLSSAGKAYDSAGISVAVSGDVVLAGAWEHGLDANAIPTGAGVVYSFMRSGNTWFEAPLLAPSDGREGDIFGYAVQMSGALAVVGAHFNDGGGGGAGLDNSGSAYVFQLGRSNGAICLSAAECASGFCVDGVCCESACSAGPCDACAVIAGATADGACTLLSGPACDDGDACTRVDTCQAGACVGGSPVVCEAIDTCQCDPQTGQCSTPEKADGESCGNGTEPTNFYACATGSGSSSGTPFSLLALGSLIGALTVIRTRRRT